MNLASTGVACSFFMTCSSALANLGDIDDKVPGYQMPVLTANIVLTSGRNAAMTDHASPIIVA